MLFLHAQEFSYYVSCRETCWSYWSLSTSMCLLICLGVHSRACTATYEVGISISTACPLFAHKQQNRAHSQIVHNLQPNSEGPLILSIFASTTVKPKRLVREIERVLLFAVRGSTTRNSRSQRHPNSARHCGEEVNCSAQGRWCSIQQ